MKYIQREIVLVPFPYSDLTSSKQRPALIISNTKINSTEDKVCCLITSNPSSGGIHIDKKDFEKGTLPLESWVKPQRLFSVNEKIIRKSLCKVSISFHKKIINEINKYLDCE